MHELSLVMSIIDIAQQHALDADAHLIEEIELDIGTLSSVEMDAFDFAWSQAVKNTLLAGAIRKINRIEGKGTCLDCDAQISLQQVYDVCPQCGSHFINVLSGKEFRVKTLLVS
ncbi:MAG: hydrogenase maturation nickel metallochaperone HypA [Bacteroidetes bacterium B1(2017)]|nr:MAG: hydrogenase maturation nickel metallochaperone HypA [Bacteroidetes bacterium B1(2017)]